VTEEKTVIIKQLFKLFISATGDFPSSWPYSLSNCQQATQRTCFTLPLQYSNFTNRPQSNNYGPTRAKQSFLPLFYVAVEHAFYSDIRA
jgi:hypothetical protein